MEKLAERKALIKKHIGKVRCHEHGTVPKLTFKASGDFNVDNVCCEAFSTKLSEAAEKGTKAFIEKTMKGFADRLKPRFK